VTIEWQPLCILGFAICGVVIACLAWDRNALAHENRALNKELAEAYENASKELVAAYSAHQRAEAWYMPKPGTFAALAMETARHARKDD